MTSITSFREFTERPRTDDGVIRDYRQRLADEQLERAERKRKDVAEQRSELNDAQARIQAWEKVHALRLPTSPTHPMLRLIAETTELALKDILEEQSKRSGGRLPGAHNSSGDEMAIGVMSGAPPPIP